MILLFSNGKDKKKLFLPLKMNAIIDFLQKMDFPVYLAPMEGVTDGAFRRICKEYGADVLISEFVSSDALSILLKVNKEPAET